MSNRPKIKEHKSILLDDVPADVQKTLIEKQKEECAHCKCHRGQNYALYKIVREWNSTFGIVNQPFILVDGHHHAIQNMVIEFHGTEVVITARLPITSKVGSILNYDRIQKK